MNKQTIPHIFPTVWTIAASDSGGGAGIQADLKTFFDLGVHGCSVITAITAQNTQGVHALQVTTNDLLKSQLGVLAEDLFPAAIKIGVLASVDSVQIVMEAVQQINETPVIFDTVLTPTQGKEFTQGSSEAVIEAIIQLLPHVDLLTPNIPEAETLTGIVINDTESQQLAAEKLVSMGASAVLLKGGHVSDTQQQCQDLFYSKEHIFWLTQDKQQTKHSHGTGCVLSSAITAFIAQDKPIHDAVVLANAYVSKGLRLAVPHNGRDGGNTDEKTDNYRQGSVVQTSWPDNLRDFPQVSYTSKVVNFLPMPLCDVSEGKGSKASPSQVLSLGLYPVIDSLEWLKKLLQIGIKTIQLRVKDLTENEVDVMIEKASALGHQYKARVFINDYWQLAIKHQAYGVHLGQEDMQDADVDAIRQAGLRLGISTHGEFEFAYAATFKPSYLAIGAIFPTETKEVIEVGLENLHDWTKILKEHYPLVAIGGINKHNIHSVVESGVGSIAVVSAITKADDYKKSVDELTKLMS